MKEVVPPRSLITSSRVRTRHRRLASVSVMKSPRTSNITNNDGEQRDQPVLNEQTPLLKKEVARFSDAVPSASEIDEEAAQESVDGCPVPEETRSIGGIISILLIGMVIVLFSGGFSFFLKIQKHDPMSTTSKPRLTSVRRRIHWKCRYFACPRNKWNH